MNTHVERAPMLALLCILLAISGCARWNERLLNVEQTWIEENFPIGMTEKAFNAMAPDAWIVHDQGGAKEYQALVRRSCFALCRTLEGGLQSSDILHAAFEFENGLLTHVGRIEGSDS